MADDDISTFFDSAQYLSMRLHTRRHSLPPFHAFSTKKAKNSIHTPRKTQCCNSAR